tara:strand:- start:17157 stop:20690 length:3534 start_codon:yes stop_codon:yes gene_type:complete
MASRTGSARVFFEVVGSFQAERLLKDAKASAVVMNAIMLDAAGGVAESIQFAFEGISDLIQEQIDSFYEFEEAMIQIRKFYQGSPKEIGYFADESKRLGETFGFSGAEALTAAANMAQMQTVLGSSQAVVAGTEMGLLFAEIGNMETQEAMKKLTSLMQQTGFAMGGLTKEVYENMDAQMQANVIRGNTIRVLDQLNTIENSSVATMQDMTFVLNQFASQANLAGETMGSMAALAAMLLEAGEETSRAGTGLRMMFSRLAVDGGDASKAIAAIIPHLDAETISTMSLTGVIKELMPHYQKLENIEKIRLTQAIAGNRHYVKLQKLLENHERLLQLNEMAYSGAFTAAEEFANRQESDVFKIDRAQAAIENLRVEVGENLADAYLSALAPSYHFLTILKKISAEEGLGLGPVKVQTNNIIANIMYMAEVMKQLEVPTNFILGLFNIIISYQTLQVILNQNTEAQNLHTEAFQKRLFVMQQTANLKLRFHSEEILSIKETQQAEFESFSARLRSEQALIAGRTRAITQNEASIQLIYKKHRALGSLDNATKIQQSTELMLAAEGHAAKIIQHRQDMMMARDSSDSLRKIMTLRKTIAVNQLNYFTMNGGQRAAQQKDQKAFLGHIAKEGQYLTQHIVLFKELTEEEIKHLGVKMQANNVAMRTEQLLLSEARLKLQLGDLDELEKQDLIETIMLREANMVALTGERVAIEGVVNANVQLIGRTKVVAIQNINLAHSISIQTGQYKQLNGAIHFTGVAFQHLAVKMYGSAAAIKASMASMMGIVNGVLGVMILFNQSGDKMAEIMIAMAVANGIYTLSLKVMTAAASKATYSLIVMEMVASLGTAAVVIGASLLAAKLLWEQFKPENSFKSTITDITNLENASNDLFTTMTDLDKRSGTFEENFMDTTWEAIKQDSAVAMAALEATNKRIDFLTEEGLRMEADSGEAKANAGRILYYQQLATELGVVTDAHRIMSDEFDYGFDQMSAGKYSDIKVKTPLWSDQQEQQYQGALSNNLYSASQIASVEAAKNAKATFSIVLNNIKLEFSTRVEAEQALADEQMRLDYERHQKISIMAEEYKMTYGQVLGMVDETGDAFIDTVGTALGELNEFANAREELFFGDQANFQGSIYKQITQGGVESLLHRVEIIQTNNFNGVTLDEAIERVSDGVVLNLRAQGVPV